MKKSYLAMAALAAIGGAAQAQTNVTIYGLIDNGVEYTTNANATGDKQVRMTSGGMNTSRWGLRGTEDLGSGLKAVMQLEGGIKTDTGEFDSTGVIFNRQANVGLEGSFGRTVAGRMYSTTYDFILPFDPMGYAPSYSWATSAGATGGRKDGMLTGVSNAIKYEGKFGAFKLGANYGFGESAGNTATDAKFAVGAGFGSGPFAAALTYERQNPATTTAGVRDKINVVHLAGSYEVVSGIKLFAAIRDYKKTFGNGTTPEQRSNTYWTGVTYQMTPALTLAGAVYYEDIKNLAAGTDADPKLYVLRAKYALSKHTSLYTAAGFARAKNNQKTGVSRDDPGFASSQNGLIAGIQHRF